jgi:SAM-dependent methyltransferase
MRLLERWLENFPPADRILDLGCGPGSLPNLVQGLRVTGVDVDIHSLANNKNPAACAESHQLPFASSSFDLILCHHTLEHFPDLPGTIREIRRVLKPHGRLFVSIPDGASFSDRLYRLLFSGGGHVQQFHFDSIVAQIEHGTCLHLASWQQLHSSFLFVDRRNFLPAPAGPLPGPFPRRMRWLSHLPGWFYSGTRIFLNLATRRTRFSQYGWALAFGPDSAAPREEPAHKYVCMFCGAGFDRPASGSRCPYCFGRNYLL